MSNVKKTKKLVPIQEDSTLPPAEPKKRAPRAKKQITKEEAMKKLEESANETKQMIQDLKDDEMKLSSISLKVVPQLIKDEIEDLNEDLAEIDEKYEELKSLPLNEQEK